MLCAPYILHILLAAQLATKKSLVPEDLFKHTKCNFSLPKVCILTELIVQPDSSSLEKGAGKMQWVMRLVPKEGGSCLEYQHIFSVSFIVTLCAFIRFFSLLLQLRDQMAPMHNALNHGKAGGICYG